MYYYRIMDGFLLKRVCQVHVFIISIFLGACSAEIAEENEIKKFSRTLPVYGVLATVTSIKPLIIGGITLSGLSEASIKMNGIADYKDNLEIGHYVGALFVDDEDHYRLLSIDIFHVVVGPIVAVIKDRIVAVGQYIVPSVSLDGSYPLLEPGHWIAVSGIRRTDKVIEATNIKRLPSQAAGLVRGEAGAITTTTIAIGKSRFLIRAPLPPIVSGETVLVRFTVKGSRFRTLGVSSLATNPFSRDVASATIEGYVVSGDDGHLRLAGLPYILIGSNSVHVGDHVIIRGQFAPGQILKVSQLDKVK